jgi:hypothetical protein
MFFKALGILLFLVEIGWFVVRPLMAEMRNGAAAGATSRRPQAGALIAARPR